MANAPPHRESDPVCDRCDEPLDESHWVRLSAAHCGPNADRFRDVERRVCPDCLAASGMLELADEPPGSTRDSASRIRTRLATVRSIRDEN